MGTVPATAGRGARARIPVWETGTTRQLGTFDVFARV